MAGKGYFHGTYRDAEGRCFVIPPKPEAFSGHKSGHIPIEWMVDAAKRAMDSEVLIRIELEPNGVAVIARNGDDYAHHQLTWEMMDKAPINPIILAIHGLEGKMRVLGNAKAKLRRKGK